MSAINVKEIEEVQGRLTELVELGVMTDDDARDAFTNHLDSLGIDDERYMELLEEQEAKPEPEPDYTFSQDKHSAMIEELKKLKEENDKLNEERKAKMLDLDVFYAAEHDACEKNEELKEEIAKLKEENAKLKENSPKPSVVKELEAQVTALKQEIAKVKAKNKELVDEICGIAELKTENDELKQEIAELKKPNAYHDLQKKCKTFGLKAVGKREVLEQRIQEHETKTNFMEFIKRNCDDELKDIIEKKSKSLMRISIEPGVTIEYASEFAEDYMVVSEVAIDVAVTPTSLIITVTANEGVPWYLEAKEHPHFKMPEVTED
eukprot:COSAG06_NODE_3034_length_5938_cov_4.195239_3_plen_321_part_00